jgi:hypothetical protein
VDGVAAVDYIQQGITDLRNPFPSSIGFLSSYPNPVNGTVTLSLVLPKYADGKLVIYDLLGRKVWEDRQKQFLAGRNQLQINATQFSSGVFFARFEGVANPLSHKIVVLK